MSPAHRKIAVVVGAAVLAAGAGIGVAAGGDSAASGAQPATSQPGFRGGDGPGGGGPGGGGPGGGFGARGGVDLSAAAEELGVSEDRLEQALDAAREDAAAAGTRPDPSAITEALAADLGVSVDKVEAALDSLMPRGGHDRGAPPDGTTPPDTSPS